MKITERWSRFDAADGLATEADMVAYLQAALEDGDPALLTAAFDDVVRARTKLRGQPRYTLEELLAHVTPAPPQQVRLIGVQMLDWNVLSNYGYLIRGL